MAAAVVGIGLFLAPMESAQAQGSGVPTVVSVDITSCSFGSFTFDQELSATYYWPNGYFRSVSYSSCYHTGGYTVVELVPAVWGWYAVRMEWNWIPDLDSEWVSIWVWMGSDSDSTPPSAFVCDSTNSSSPSAGTPYYVDLYVDGYLVSGPSVE